VPARQHLPLDAFVWLKGLLLAVPPPAGGVRLLMALLTPIGPVDRR